MSLNEAFAKLRKLRVSVIRTNDAAGVWGTSRATASTMLARLSKVGHISRLTRGLWLIDSSVNPWLIHPFLTEPAPSYISLTTALFHHGMIEQIPSTIHVVTTAKPKVFETPIASYVLHQVAPRFFSGFEALEGGPAQMALPEKALVDFFYFRPTRTRSFRALPELELSKGFSKPRARRFAALIASRSRRAMVTALLGQVLG